MGTISKKAKIIEFLEREYIVPDSRLRIDFTKWAWQKQILSELFQTMNGDKRMFTAAIISTPRQQGKSLILQCIGLYMLICGGLGLNIYSIACDRDQAALVPDRVKKSIQFNPRLADIVNITRNVLTCPTNGNTWTILSSDKASAPGITADVLLWDELALLPEHNWNLFYLLLPSQSARSEPLILIASTVGESEEGPFDGVLKIGRDEEESHTYIYETTEIKSPLSNEAQIERDRILMPQAVFARHYENIVIRGASFISDDDIEAIVRPLISSPNLENRLAYIGNDWGLTKDKCAIARIAKLSNNSYVWNGGRIFRGSKEKPVDLNTAADAARDLFVKRYTKKMVFDKWQAVSTIQQMQQEYGEDKVEGYDFTNTSRKRLFKNLFTLIRDGQFAIYSDRLQDCWKQSCLTCSHDMQCKEQVPHELLRELQGLQCDSDFNVTHGRRGDDVTVAAALALLAAAKSNASAKKGKAYIV